MCQKTPTGEIVAYSMSVLTPGGITEPVIFQLNRKSKVWVASAPQGQGYYVRQHDVDRIERAIEAQAS